VRGGGAPKGAPMRIPGSIRARARAGARVYFYFSSCPLFLDVAPDVHADARVTCPSRERVK